VLACRIGTLTAKINFTRLSNPAEFAPDTIHAIITAVRKALLESPG